MGDRSNLLDRALITIIKTQNKGLSFETMVIITLAEVQREEGAIKLVHRPLLAQHLTHYYSLIFLV